MALYNRPDPRIEAEARKRASMAIMPSSAPPKPRAVAFSGAPAALTPQVQKPQTTMRAPVQARDVTRVDVGMRPVAPPSATAPAPGSLPGAPVRPAPPPPTDVTGTPGKGMDTTGPTSQEDIDQLIRDRVLRELQGGGVNTAEQEALIKQQMEGVIGSGSVNARARAGAAGMASSGALMAQEGDLSRAAREAATQQILGERRDAREEQFGREGAAIDSEMGMRQAAADDEINRRLLEMLGMEPDAAPGGGGMGAPPSAIVDPIAAGLGAETTAPSLVSSGKGDAGLSSRNPVIVTAPPAGATLVNESASFGGALYLGTDGKYYGVK